MPKATPLVFAVASQPYPGEVVSGDRALVLFTGKQVLVAVIDGLGHGPLAAAAADAAVTTLRAAPLQTPEVLMAACHQVLGPLRGAVMCLVTLDSVTGEMSWLSVGNVQAVLWRAGADGDRLRVTEKPGLVGRKLPALAAQYQRLVPGDTLIMATDGVSPDFARLPPHPVPVEILARELLKDYGHTKDDSLVLVLRFLGSTP